jgi:hypothetical protein
MPERGRPSDVAVKEGFDETRRLKAEARARLDARILHLLSQGERPVDVARACGVSESVVSRVRKES